MEGGRDGGREAGRQGGREREGGEGGGGEIVNKTDKETVARRECVREKWEHSPNRRDPVVATVKHR